jgi:hypothetical protein
MNSKQTLSTRNIALVGAYLRMSLMMIPVNLSLISQRYSITSLVDLSMRLVLLPTMSYS